MNECKRSHPSGVGFGDVVVTSAGKIPHKRICHGVLYPVWCPAEGFSLLV